MKTVLFFMALVTIALAHKSFMLMIPNGSSVPHPCNSSIVWRAVGHSNRHGGHIVNPFGVAFHHAGTKWTVELCKADSDKDGRSNGAELGDPACIWKMGATPAGKATSHPGICEPLGSPLCKNERIKCGA